MKKISLLWFLLFCFVLSAESKEIKRWALYYGNQAPYSAFVPYSLVVLDGHSHPNLNWFIERNITTLGYLSLAEVEQNQFYFKDVKDENLLLNENPNWKGSYSIDLRDKRWVKRVIEELIPSLLFQRFNGVFLDTLDNAEFLEQQNPQKYKGMRQAAVKLIKAIRLHYPQMPIMMNRAYSLLPEVGDSINFILGESVYSTYNFEKKIYERVSQQNYETQVQLLKQAQARFPHLRVFTLDYANPEDIQEIKKIYEVERSQNFVPYVSTINLDKLILEPND